MEQIESKTGQGDGGHQVLQRVTVRGTNYDGSDHWVHPASLLQVDGSLVVTKTEAGLNIARQRGTFTSRFNTHGYYWKDRWFNVIRLELPGQGLEGFYCNIATPLVFDGESVRYTDLQLDVRVYAEANGSLSWTLLDEDDFEVARDRYGYSDGLIERCYKAVDQCVGLVKSRAFPFDR